jgi:hypothetical protein
VGIGEIVRSGKRREMVFSLENKLSKTADSLEKMLSLLSLGPAREPWILRQDPRK